MHMGRGAAHDRATWLQGEIRPGRSTEAEHALLWQLNKLIVQVVNPRHWYLTLGHFTTEHLIEDGQLLSKAGPDEDSHRQ